MYAALRKAEQEAVRQPDEKGIVGNPFTETGRMMYNNKLGRKTAYGEAGDSSLPEATLDEFAYEWEQTPAHADFFHSHPRTTFPAVSLGDMGAWSLLQEGRKDGVQSPYYLAKEKSKGLPINSDAGMGVVQFPDANTARSTIWRNVIPPIDEFNAMIEVKDLPRAGLRDIISARDYIRKNFPEHADVSKYNISSAVGAQRAANQGLVDYYTDLHPEVDALLKQIAERYPQKKKRGGLARAQ